MASCKSNGSSTTNIKSSKKLSKPSSSKVTNAKTSTSTSKIKSKAGKKVRSCRKSFKLDAKAAKVIKDNNYEIKERLGTGAFSEASFVFDKQQHSNSYFGNVSIGVTSFWQQEEKKLCRQNNRPRFYEPKVSRKIFAAWIGKSGKGTPRVNY